ncbi:hypothetical protein PAPYR_2218 [Paratrimastix pyriformis]|uniref:Ubiquitin-like domain-containing protein n=1 Tax=Paratrimastix pyriformis TaxID=342808 RepID=A0ABQ8UPV4_9EUKA|nr:hypothetical protein PAPYR_2218 [Paratrimastix pyriformis]
MSASVKVEARFSKDVLCVELEPSKTVQNLKELLAGRFPVGTVPGDIRLLYGGKFLNNDHLLSQVFNLGEDIPRYVVMGMIRDGLRPADAAAPSVKQARVSPTEEDGPPNYFDKLPDDLVLLILRPHIETPTQMFQLMRTCRRFMKLVPGARVALNVNSVPNAEKRADGLFRAYSTIRKLTATDYVSRLVDAATAHCHDIEEVHFNKMLLKPDSLVAFLRGSCPRLHTLDFTSFDTWPFTDAAAEALIPAGPTLAVLKIHCCAPQALTDAGMARLVVHLPHLRQFELRGCPSIGDACLAALGESHPPLETIGLCPVSLGFRDQPDQPITEAGILSFARGPGHFPHLRSVTLAAPAAFTDAALAGLGAACPALEEIRLLCADQRSVAMPLGDDGMRALLTACPRIEVLEADGAPALTDGAFPLPSPPAAKLRIVSFSRCPKLGLTDAFRDWLVQRPAGLVELTLEDDPQVGDGLAVAVIARHGATLQSLDLSRKRALKRHFISNATMEAIAAHRPPLRRLGISGCADVTQKGLRAFIDARAEMGPAAPLCFVRCERVKAMTKALEKAMTRCMVTWSDPALRYSGCRE